MLFMAINQYITVNINNPLNKSTSKFCYFHQFTVRRLHRTSKFVSAGHILVNDIYRYKSTKLLWWLNIVHTLHAHSDKYLPFLRPQQPILVKEDKISRVSLTSSSIYSSSMLIVYPYIQMNR